MPQPASPVVSCSHLADENAGVVGEVGHVVHGLGAGVEVAAAGQAVHRLQHRIGGVSNSAANRLIGEVVQSRRRPLLGPSPG